MKLPILFGIHCHQPVDNFSNIVDEIIQKSYLPFAQIASRYKNFKFAIHYSGWLFEYIKNKNPQLFSLFKKLLDQGQIEIFTGGYYEPILSAIPKRDRILQIKKLNSFIYENFGVSPKGLWLTERVWDPSIIPDVVECGIEYLVVDDYHFISMGFHKDNLYGYFISEQDGLAIKIFPIDQTLRYFIPFKELNEIDQYLKEIIHKGGKGAILFDDGEKFGVWPKTYEWVYEKGWLEKFLDLFTSSKDFQFMHYYDFVEKNPPMGLAYLPLTSYYEMGEWSLFADKFIEMERLSSFLKKTEFQNIYKTYLKGAHWKNFFIKYPESNHIHKRLLAISKKAYTLNDPLLNEYLFKGECNDVLWHGIFGGIYLPNLRDNTFKYIIKAEKRITALEGDEKIKISDLLFDGYGCCTLRNRNLATLWTIKHGGQLKSLDLLESEINLCNTLSRRWEGYHDTLLRSKEESTEATTGITTIHEMNITLSEEVKNKIAFDWYDRNSFVDHIVENYTPEEIAYTRYKEIGDFTNQPFELIPKDDQIIFERKGGIYLDKMYKTNLKKSFSLKDKGISFEIEINSSFTKNLYYILEFNFHFFNYNKLKVNGKKVGDILSNKNNLFIIDAGDTMLEINLDKKTEAIVYLVNTAHQSEQGVDFTTQGVCVALPFKFRKELTVSGFIKVM
ncbi:MAG: DUF1926 domain-containing protein [Calditerrivibrio sp.]|nr:DUF1926 domain-containing protein [Calditerrivibrio sp.]